MTKSPGTTRTVRTEIPSLVDITYTSTAEKKGEVRVGYNLNL